MNSARGGVEGHAIGGRLAASHRETDAIRMVVASRNALADDPNQKPVLKPDPRAERMEERWRS
jgi:hypothetical protein